MNPWQNVLNVCSQCPPGYLTFKALRHGSHSFACNYTSACLYQLPRKRSADGASPDWGCGHLIAAYYSFIYPERMKGWVGLVGWPTATYPQKFSPVSCKYNVSLLAPCRTPYAETFTCAPSTWKGYTASQISASYLYASLCSYVNMYFQ